MNSNNGQYAQAPHLRLVKPEQGAFLQAPNPGDHFSTTIKNSAPSTGATSSTAMVSHYELDAKLEAIEARADARMSRFEERIDQAIVEMRRDREDIKSEFKADKTERRAEMRGLKITIVTTAIATVIGLYAANISLIQTMFASYESGKSTASAITQATEQLKQTQQQLETIQKSLLDTRSTVVAPPNEKNPPAISQQR